MGTTALAISAALVIFAQAAPTSPTSPPDLTRAALRDYLNCQGAAAKALDDGRSSEDAIATQVVKRCETQYEAYRQASYDKYGFSVDNRRQDALIAVNSYRKAMVRMAELKTCVRSVADRSDAKREPFERIVDQAVVQCTSGGLLVQQHLTPTVTVSEQQIRDLNEHQKKITRTEIARQLRQLVKSTSSASE